MSEIDDGGPAFPMDTHQVGNAGGCSAGGGIYTAANRGMSLRDYFAGQVAGQLVSVAFSLGHLEGSGWATAIARDAYMMADAMLKARKR